MMHIFKTWMSILLIALGLAVLLAGLCLRSAESTPRQTLVQRDADLQPTDRDPPAPSLSVAAASPLPTSPPIASLISIGPADIDGNAVISGAPGAVEPLVTVVLASPDTRGITATQALADGSFQTTWFAPAGAWLQVKSAYEVPETLAPSGESDVSWMNPLLGTMVRAPVPDQVSTGTLPFAAVGDFLSEGGSGSWMLQGHIITQTVGPTVNVAVSGTLSVATAAITSGTTISDGQVAGLLGLNRLFDQEGNSVTIDGLFARTFSNTPTGLPISRNTSNSSPFVVPVPVANWTYAGGHVMATPISGTLQFPASTQPGYYRPYIALGFQGIPVGPGQPGGRAGHPSSSSAAHLPVFRLGQPAPPRLVWTLLSNTLSNATRGTTARQDKAYFGLSPHIVTQADTFIVPRTDARSGAPIAYRLEPFMPMIAFADRGVSGRPMIPFRFPSGGLQVNVQRPDGIVDTIGPAPFLQSLSQGLSNADGKALDMGGGRIDDLYQLTTLDDAFAYTFPLDGHYVITMTGTIEDIWGHVYGGGGTYDVHVARPLTIESGQLPTTPYEVGDSFASALHVYPPVPAAVGIRLLHMPYSDPAQAILYETGGRANRFGYLQPSAGTVITLTAPGEFRVDIEARYAAPDGTLWMGSATWGNAVERPGTALVAHGRRGLDLAGPHSNLWFFHRQTFSGLGLHSMYPYFTGDILWGNQTDDWCGGNAIIPALTVQDTAGAIQSIIEQRWTTKKHSDLFEGVSFQDRVQSAEIPLFSTTSDGQDLFWSPERVDQVGYAYRSSERPGVRVHETISEDALGVAYWRFDAEFGLQAGFEGDLPNDLKWQFGSAVFRVITDTNPINEYAIYGSLWVLTPDEDVVGSRVTPPFQGAAGGPDGGPIMTLKGQDIDIFFMPKGVQPGDVLEAGDTVSFSGHVGPPLASRVMVTVTSPSGATSSFEGQANKVGWFYQPEADFVADEPGVWTVDMTVRHDSPVPSTGLVPAANNTGGVLGTANGRYYFYVVERDSPRLSVLSPQPGYLTWPTNPMTVTVVPITVSVPPGLTDIVVSYTIRMPGFVLEQGTLTPSGNTFTILFDPLTLHQDFPNLDLKVKDADRPGLTDQVWVSFMLSGGEGPARRHRAGTVLFNGEEVQIPPVIRVYLPLILRSAPT